MKYDCLIVDDEKAISESASKYFNMFDVKTHWVTTVKECEDFFLENEAEVILLDINLGEESGFNLCKKLRETIDVPILFISARTSDDDVLLALNIGGDDYIQKPCSLSVLLAKVKSVLKRYRSSKEKDQKTDEDLFKIEYDMERIYYKGQELKLKALEFKLLTYLLENKNRVIPKEELFRNVWGDVITGDGTLNVHIRRIREKIEDNPNEPVMIKTIWGKGYLLEVDFDEK